MKEKILYVADDGSEFTNKEECECYEKLSTIAEEHIHAYDADFKPVKWQDMDSIAYIRFDTIGALYKFNASADDWGSAGINYWIDEEAVFNDPMKELPFEKRYWYWDDCNYTYKNLMDLIESKEKEYNSWKNFIEKFKD